MLLSDDLRKSVVFFGFADTRQGKGGINCVGTGFLVVYEDQGYLVTARHCALQLGSDPFLVRLNRKDGTSENIQADDLQWKVHQDETVDVAAIPFQVGSDPYDCRYIPKRMLLTDELLSHESSIGIGSLTYTIGLFRLMSGEKRNLPVAHFGIISMVPRDEKIPVRDWNDATHQRILNVEGYLVESQSIEGLSGSPTFVRATASLPLTPPGIMIDPRALVGLPASMHGLLPREDVFLLGLWASAWDAPPDEAMGIQAGRPVRVPVGMGVVISAQKIVDVLELDELREMRKQAKKERESRTEAASPDSAIPLAKPASEPPPATDANPTHREDFNSLLGEAARKREREG